MAEAVLMPSAIPAFLTSSRGAFNMVPTATAWLLKDIGFVFVAGSLLLVDTELTLNVCDLVFLCISSFVSAALLASLMDKKQVEDPYTTADNPSKINSATTSASTADAETISVAI
ncbi:hypothetical protein MRX96_035366 [Rhipicephalus microplus]